MLGLALSLTLALALAGCSLSPGGSTRPSGYTCVNNLGGCYSVLSLSPTHINGDGKPDIPGDPNSAESDLYITPLSCDMTCQKSSGTATPGFIANYLQLWDSKTGWFIRTGYETTPGGSEYFLQYWLGDLQPLPNGFGGFNPQPPTGTVQFGLTGVEPGYVTGPKGYPLVTFEIGPSAFGGPGTWAVLVQSPANFIGLWAAGPTAFHPDSVFYVQQVYGTGGASAKASGFVNNSVYASPNENAFDAVLGENGTPPFPIQTADHPSNALWAISPHNSSSGGFFWVACCQPS
jgi:hypothetical protein